ncbi:hypothetical protein [Nocardiopsis sp. NRRL B-16309]|uniref:hypothetical protein n=1 Tax=Nocardiopsis sp. NRRL B-16309 TaxID=1519494 RepID=UPI0012E24BBF|nr:hypothetical protein [Nocardiopsis sp. NRRL B-16309]
MIMDASCDTEEECEYFMIEEIVHITPELLRTELEDLRNVDWTSIWSGPPHPGTPDVQRWCDRYGWKALTTEFDLDVQTRHGNKLDLQSNGFWHPVVSVVADLWRAISALPETKEEVVSLGVASWENYLAQGTGVFGEPSWLRHSGSKDYPRAPYDGLWSRPRSSQDNPYRLACWDLRNPYDDSPIILLEQSVSLRTWQAAGGAGSSARISFNAPRKLTRG